MGEKFASYHCEVDTVKEQRPHTTEIWMSLRNWQTQTPRTVLRNDFFLKKMCVTQTMSFPYLSLCLPVLSQPSN